jgi:ABC-type sugar transport system ATPase subunit
LGNISLTLRAGEVLGVGGLAGSGRTELARAIIGADPIDKGQIWIKGEKVTIRSPAQAVERGIFMVPEERKRLGIVAGLDVARNITISAPGKIAVSTFVQEALEKRIAEDYVSQLRIKTSSSSESIENPAEAINKKFSLPGRCSRTQRLLSSTSRHRAST